LSDFIVFNPLNHFAVVTMLQRLRQQTKETLEAHQEDVQKALRDIGDFELALKWEFHSWGKSIPI